MKITRRQLRRIIRESLNEVLPPHLQKHFRSDGSSVNDPEWEDVTPAGYGPDDTAAPPQKLKVGDLVRSVDYRGDGWGGDFERILGNFPGMIIEIDDSEDGPIQYVVNWPAGEPTMVSADELELVKEAKMKITKRQLRRIIREERRRILSEVPFHDSSDEDRPGKKQTVVFDEDETYDVAGNTHGKESHAIKHFGEFEPEQFKSAVEDAINIAKDAEEIHIINPAGDVVQSDDAAKKSMNVNAMLNTLDLINDKQKNGEPLNTEEEKLAPTIQGLTDSYDDLVQSYLDDAEDIDNVESADEIKAKIDSGTILKFTGDYKGTLATYYLDPSNSGLVAEIDGSVATLFRIDKRGGSLQKIAGYFARGVELTNSALTTALSSGEEEADEQPQEQKKEKKQKKQQSASTPEDFVKQLKARGLPDQALKGALTGWMKKNAPDRVGEIDTLLAAGRKTSGAIITERWQILAGLIK